MPRISPLTVENLKRRVYAKLDMLDQSPGQPLRLSATDGGELPELTARESDILQSVARGDSIRQTARALGISPKTENTQTRLFRKLGVRNRAEAFAVVDALGMLPDDRTRAHA